MCTCNVTWSLDFEFASVSNSSAFLFKHYPCSYIMFLIHPPLYFACRYAWGRGFEGQLGLGSVRCSLTPRYVGSLSGVPIVQIASGVNFSAAITGTLRHLSSGFLLPIHTAWFLPFKPFSCFSPLLISPYTVGGELYMWGDGSSGQLGQGGDKTQRAKSHFSPVRVDALLGTVVKQISCGWAHTAALSCTSVHCFPVFKLVPMHIPCISFHGVDVIALCLSSGRANVCLGLGSARPAWTRDNLPCLRTRAAVGALSGRPRREHRVRRPFHACTHRYVALYCRVGVSGTSSLSGVMLLLCFVVAASHDVYSWGSGKNGRLGHGDGLEERNARLLMPLYRLHTSAVAAGWSHAFAVTEGSK